MLQQNMFKYGTFTCPAWFDHLKVANQRVLNILQTFHAFLQNVTNTNTYSSMCLRESCSPNKLPTYQNITNTAAKALWQLVKWYFFNAHTHMMLVVMKHFHYTQERISTRINRAQAWAQQSGAFSYTQERISTWIDWAQAWGPTVWGDCARIKISLNMLKFVTANTEQCQRVWQQTKTPIFLYIILCRCSKKCYISMPDCLSDAFNYKYSTQVWLANHSKHTVTPLTWYRFHSAITQLSKKNLLSIPILLVPWTHNKLGDRSFSAAGSRLRDDLPPGLRRPGLSLDSFQRSLKTHLFGDWSA